MKTLSISTFFLVFASTDRAEITRATGTSFERGDSAARKLTLDRLAKHVLVSDISYDNNVELSAMSPTPGDGNVLKALLRKKRDNDVQSRTDTTATNDNIFLIHDYGSNRTRYHGSKNTAQYWATLLAPLDKAFGSTFAANTEDLDLLLSVAPRALGVGLQADTSPILAAINPYGCWCNFENMPSPFGGQPVNEIDEACRVLQEGYRCIQLDHENTCDSTSAGYEAPPRYMGIRDKVTLVNKIHSHCARVNVDDPCNYKLCTVEAYFINTLFMYMMSGKRIDLTASHKMGFNAEEMCVKKTSVITNPFGSGDGDSDILDAIIGNGGSPGSPKSPKDQPSQPKDHCCGVYPIRAPYNASEEKSKSCCNGEHIFNTFTHQCCDDGSLVVLGGC